MTIRRCIADVTLALTIVTTGGVPAETSAVHLPQPVPSVSRSSPQFWCVLFQRLCAR